MTDASGTVLWAADYKPFGEVNLTTNDITNNLRFPGQYYDEETGLHQNWNRDYSPAVGNYIEADPVGINRGKNHLYVYVKNSPIMKSDPTGLNPGPCGNEGSKWVPDHPYWIFDFSSACQAHDDCYSNCQGGPKAKCDNDFLNDLTKLCFTKYIFLGPFYLGLCQSAAVDFYIAVAGGAGTAFNNAREKCNCKK